ncbi:alpha/beta hydrolase-fold protein [Alishewanella longhuensis]
MSGARCVLVPNGQPGREGFIMGSSMGGLISWYAQTQYPQVFGGAAALSTHWPVTLV